IMALVFAGTILLGFPIAFVLGLSGLDHFIAIGNPMFLDVMVNRIFSGIDNIGLMAIPFFILAGEFMNVGGVTKRIVDFVREIVGFVSGGLAYAVVIIGALLSSILGSTNAVASILGSALVPEMVDDGYPDDFSASLVASTSMLGTVLPPSVTMIFFSVITGVSVGGLFLAGIVPGILLACGFALNIGLYSKFKRKLPKNESFKFNAIRFAKAFAYAIPALIVPVILIGGILSGVFTPSESGAVSVLAAFLASLFYRSFDFKKLPGMFVRSAKASAGIFIIIGFGNVIGWSFAIDGIPQMIAGAILSISDNPTIIILVMLFLLLVIGLFMESTAKTLLLAPVTMPIALGIGMDPVHFGVIFCIMMTLALITPPVGVTLFVTSNITGVSVNRMSVAMVPFAAMAMIITTILAFMPDLVLFIPRMLQ
ncbi:MAG: TRAP transporter large permease, partial [Defluviitaleaceae bacterium]|nr:TRAP transporter large permease [Defluviitaleaceae bacterium]